MTRRGGSTPVTTSVVYDAAGQLASLQHSTSAGVLEAYGITRDTRGNPTRVDTTTGDVTTSALYTYDAVSRLRSECYPATGDVCVAKSPRNAYTYDLVGNRTSETSRTVVGTKATTVKTDYTYDAADELLTKSVDGTATVTNTWSPNGALATSTTPTGTQTYVTDLTDELMSLTLEDGSTVGYTHDAQGNRTSRTIDGLLDATWVWDDLSSLPMRVGEYDAAGTLTTGASLAQTSSGVSSWLLSDPFANTVASVSTTGSVVSGTRSMDAFGVQRTTATGSLADASIGFAGQYLDTATGMYDMRARDYDPTSGRFTATDPVAVPTGMPFVAGYSYAYNNPLMFADPTGMYSIGDWWDTVKGQAAAVKDFALNDIALTQPNLGGWAAQRRYNMYRGFRSGVQDYGWGTQIDRTINPAHQLLEAGDATITAYKQGDYYAAGYNSVNTTIAAASTAAIACGGAKAITSRIPSVAATVANSADRIALGLTENVQGFAESIGARNLMSGKPGVWQQSLKAAANDGATQFSVSLDGVEDLGGSIARGAYREAGVPFVQVGGRSPSWFDWEMYTLDSAGAWDRTTFYLGGKVVPNPFG